ncbi:CDP-diacylglycerol--glycerol-3-phosphate 3-phosphatidyltransferase [Thermoleophilia bacterium SCSIO 60948]|nr:CDP-diacylglycerol--glycerol-3-phosphate 3-phosphatidyltransferase [Thermoleophilia bacterium SCSIO 60948]
MNLPNILTIGRIFLIPVIVVLILGGWEWGDEAGAILFALAAATDGLDGYIARRNQDVTTFGKLMDPLADKLLIVAVLIALVSLDEVAAWVAMIIIARELAITGLRSLAAEQGIVIAASWMGKVKTSLQILAILLLIWLGGDELWVELVVYAAVAATLISGADYFFDMRRVFVVEDEEGESDRVATGSAGPGGTI